MYFTFNRFGWIDYFTKCVTANFGGLGMPLILLSYDYFLRRNKPKPFRVVYDGVVKSFSAMSLLMGVGMFVQILTLNGARGYFVVNALSLPDAWQYVGIGYLADFWRNSAFASASILVDHLLWLLASNEIVVLRTFIDGGFR